MTSRALLIACGDQMGRFAERRDALIALGATVTAEWFWYVWETTTGAWSPAWRRVLIAADTSCTPEDWTSACNLLRLAGWFTGNPRYDDIGEPLHDRCHRAWLWDLPAETSGNLALSPGPPA
jgi:hypothetical protein